jgi:hypothetical protein
MLPGRVVVEQDVVVVTSGCVVVVVVSGGSGGVGSTKQPPFQIAWPSVLQLSPGVDRGTTVVVGVRERRNDVAPPLQGMDGAGVHSVATRLPVRLHDRVLVDRVLKVGLTELVA